ncbi:hypothetical protein BU17DRAFT_90099 [Hysterangium stoloniferum]|nr:hypothetical protein BU17DRAFT_90099 [Hysterangium stoloniferum]
MAFKKPFHDVKTSAPLRSSDRRKLKQRVVETFSLNPEDGDIMLPESTMSLKFGTHVDEPGVAYLSPEGDPLWFSLGKASSDLIPAVYTLWKKPNLLPVITTPSAVIPVLMGGADLMIPGVVRHPEDIRRTELVAISRYIADSEMIAPPLAVGRMAVDSQELKEAAKGKAVNVLHTFGDSLWQMGSKAEPPEPVKINIPVTGDTSAEIPQATVVGETSSESPELPVLSVGGGNDNVEGEGPSSSLTTLTPQEVTSILRSSVLQVICSQLSTMPPSAFPISSSTLYSTYILPSRPLSSEQYATPIDIKHSSHKNLTSFLKSLEKDGLLKLKDFKGALNILGVNPSHVELATHKSFTTLGDKEKTEEKKADREKAELSRVKELNARKLWKPQGHSVHFFAEIGKNTKDLYSQNDIRTIINDYITAHQLANVNEQQYIHPDDVLVAVFTAGQSSESIQYMKREDAVTRLSQRMQEWHEVTVEGKDPIVRKGALKPVSIVVKVRQGKKASTLITGFEPFLISADFLSEELKRICATSTSVSPVPGPGNANEVLVQGKQIKTVTDFLIAQGVPKRWVESTDLSGKKK